MQIKYEEFQEKEIVSVTIDDLKRGQEALCKEISNTRRGLFARFQKLLEEFIAIKQINTDLTVENRMLTMELSKYIDFEKTVQTEKIFKFS